MVSYIDRTNLAFASVQMNAELGLSASIYGLGGGLFYLCYGLFQVQGPPTTEIHAAAAAAAAADAARWRWAGGGLHAAAWPGRATAHSPPPEVP